jgi:hypothetical protein
MVSHGVLSSGRAQTVVFWSNASPLARRACLGRRFDFECHRRKILRQRRHSHVQCPERCNGAPRARPTEHLNVLPVIWFVLGHLSSVFNAFCRTPYRNGDAVSGRASIRSTELAGTRVGCSGCSLTIGCAAVTTEF